jgi:hypothetical protein
MNAVCRTLSPIAIILALAGCTPGSSPTTLTPAQVATDLTGALTALSTVEGLMVAASPKAISPSDQKTINTVLVNAQSALASLSSTTPAATGASTAAVVDGYLNTAVGILASASSTVPSLAAFAPEIDAVDAVLPAVEAFVNQYQPAPAIGTPIGGTPIGVPAAALFSSRVHSTRFTLAQARTKLRIPVRQ